MTSQPRPKRIAQAWEELYRLAFAGQGITRESRQYIECRRAFYAGASAVFYDVARLGGDDVAEDAGVELLEDLRQEIEAYGRELARAAALWEEKPK